MLSVITMCITITIPTCGTIHFLADGCLGLFFITVGTWTIWSKKMGFNHLAKKTRKTKKGKMQQVKTLQCHTKSLDVVATRDEGDHRDQPLDCVIVLALLARCRWRTWLWSRNQHQFYTLLSPCPLWSLLVSVHVV